MTYFAGNMDVPLSPLGFEQAEKTATYIAENFNPIRGKVIRVSLSKTNPYTDLVSFNLKEHH